MPELPQFPHHNPEASRQLGLPDSPTVHLAVTTVANRLLALVEGVEDDPRALGIQALRAASYAVLFSLPFEAATADFLSRCDLHADHETARRACKAGRMDWLGCAREQVLAEGSDPGPDVREMATAYGWRDVA